MIDLLPSLELTKIQTISLITLRRAQRLHSRRNDMRREVAAMSAHHFNDEHHVMAARGVARLVVTSALV